MANWREQKATAKGDIHREFSIPAVYLTHAAGQPVRVNVRLHRRQHSFQQQVDDWSNAASELGTADHIIFDQREVPAVLKNAYVIFGNSEAYKTGPTDPAVDGFVTTYVTAVAQTDLSTFLAAINTSGDAWQGIVS